MKNLNIGTRLGLVFALLIVLIVTIAGVGLVSLGNVNKATETMTQENLPKEQAVAEWARLLSSAIPKVLAMAKVHDPAQSAYFGKLLAEDTARINPIQKRVEEWLVLPRGIELYAAIADVRTVVLQHVTEIQSLKSKGMQHEADLLIDQKLAPLMVNYEQAVKNLLDFQLTLITDATDTVSDTYYAGRLILSAIALFAVLVGTLLAWRLTVGITRPLREAVSVAQAVAQGDLVNEITVSSQDETGRLMQALKEMNASLVGMVLDIRSSSENIATGSGQIAMGNSDLSQRTEQQAANITETAAAMEQLTSTVKNNSQVAVQAAQLAGAANAAAIQGGEAVEHVVVTMTEINTSSQKIVDIIGVINMIAFQTNILALNAAVEAARAGEQGRGFAVVASEVRSLAQKSAEAAKDITQLINDSVGRTRAGSDMVNAAGQAMTSIVAQVQNVTSMINEISAATAEQTMGLAQINEAVIQLSDVTQQNAALVEQSAVAAESLNGQARYLVGVVGKFKVNSNNSFTGPTLTIDHNHTPLLSY